MTPRPIGELLHEADRLAFDATGKFKRADAEDHGGNHAFADELRWAAGQLAAASLAHSQLVQARLAAGAGPEQPVPVSEPIDWSVP